MSTFRRRMMMAAKDADYLRFTATQIECTVTINAAGSPDAVNLQYRMNGGAWRNYTIGETISLPLEGDWVEFYGDNDHFSKSINDYYNFVIEHSTVASGNVMSLMGFSDSCAPYCFAKLFNGCHHLLNYGGLTLPSESLAEGCYRLMFNGCHSLSIAPDLPARELVTKCYYGTFQHCHGLNSVNVSFSSWLSGATSWWMYVVHSEGTFTCPSDLPQTRGIDNIPEGWTIVTK